MHDREFSVPSKIK